MPVDPSGFHPIINAALQLAQSRRLRDQQEFENELAIRKQTELERTNREELKNAAKRLELERQAREWSEKAQLWNAEQVIRGQYATGVRRPEVFQEGGPLKTVSPAAVVNTPMGDIGLSNLQYPADLQALERAEYQGQTPLVVDRTRQIEEVKAAADMPKLLAQLRAASMEKEADRTNRVDIAKLNIAGRLQAADKAAWSRIEAARVRGATEGAAFATNHNQLLQEIGEGQVTEESLTKRFPIKQRDAIINGANAQGLKVLKESQVKRLQGLQALSSAYQAYQRLAEAYDKGIVANAGEIYALNQEADVSLGNIARLFGGEKGVLTQADVTRSKGAKPSYFANTLDKEANKRRLANFKAHYDSEVRATLGAMTPEQAKVIFEKFNLMEPTPKPRRIFDPATGTFK